MISNLWRTNPLSPWLDVNLHYTSSTLILSELPSVRLSSTRGSAHHPRIVRINAVAVELIDVIIRAVSGSSPDH